MNIGSGNMANEQNLRVPTSEQARENGRKGGIASAKAKKERKSMRELMNILLELPVSEKNKANMETLGIKDEQLQNNKMLVAVGLMKRAITGDPRAIEVMCGVAGELTEETEKQEEFKGITIKFEDASKRDD